MENRNLGQCIGRVAVYLGSKTGSSPLFAETAGKLGSALALNKIAVVYGGTCVGTMKALADGVLEAGGDVTGVIPESFRTFEESYQGLTTLIRVRELPERKQKMEELSQAAVILPGGYGTLDELFEYAVNNQLKLLGRPIYVLNLDGFYTPLKEQLDIMVRYGLLTPELRAMIRFCGSIEEVVVEARAFFERK